MRKTLLVICATLLCGCAGYIPPAPSSPHPATSVAASTGRTWDAVIELFATRSIPIRTLERASGFIATEPLLVSDGGSRRYADCGTPPSGAYFHADLASYNVLVRGDSATSSVLVTARFVPRNAEYECASTGRWEKEFEADVKARAEGRPVPAAERQEERAITSGQTDECGPLNSVDRDGDDWRVTLYRVNGFGQCVKRNACRYRDGATSMSKETALARCTAEGRPEP